MPLPSRKLRNLEEDIKSGDLDSDEVGYCASCDDPYHIDDLGSWGLTPDKMENYCPDCLKEVKEINQ